MISNYFSSRLKELRKSHNFTLEQLGHSVGMKKNSLSNIENEKEHISFDAALRVANFFGVSLDYLTGRSDDPRFEEFIDKAEAILLSEIDDFIALGVNATLNSKNESLGSVGRMMKSFYTSRRLKYTAPLAIRELIFGVRELADKHLHPKTIKVRLVVPEFARTSSLLNPKAFLQERGFIAQEVLDIPPAKAGEKSYVQLLDEKLNKLEQDYLRSKSS